MVSSSRSIGVGAAMIILTFAVLINSGTVFGARAEFAQLVLIMLMIGGNSFMVILFSRDKEPQLLKAPIIPSVIVFSVGFVLSAVLFIFLPFVFPSTLIVAAQAVSFGVLYSLVVSFYEELMFRDAMPQLGVGPFTISGLFAFMHTTALLANPAFVATIPNFIIAYVSFFLLSLLWLFVAVRAGVAASWGSHFAYNLIILVGAAAFLGGFASIVGIM